MSADDKWVLQQAEIHSLKLHRIGAPSNAVLFLTSVCALQRLYISDVISRFCFENLLLPEMSWAQP